MHATADGDPCAPDSPGGRVRDLHAGRVPPNDGKGDNVPEWLKVVLLGALEGSTEYLPVSSTAHLLIAADLFRFRDSIGGTFEIVIQLGAILAVLAFNADDLLTQLRTFPRDAATRRFWTGLALAFLPAAALGFLLRPWIKRVLFASPTVIAWALIAGGIALIAVELVPRRPAATRDLLHVTTRQALLIGVAQATALVPGVSRSGASIVGGLLAGLDRKTATAFSFYLAIPTLGVATIFDLLAALDQLTAARLGQLALGTLVALIVAWLSIGWLLRYVAEHSFIAFGIYRIVAGILVLVLLRAAVL